MNVQIKRPTDVYEHIAKTYGTAAVYSDLIKLCDKELSDLGVELSEIADSIQREQRECLICLDSLQRASDSQEKSQEIERQRRYYNEKLEECARKTKRLRIISDEYGVLVRESQKLQEDAGVVAARLKQPVMSVRRVIEKYLSSV